VADLAPPPHILGNKKEEGRKADRAKKNPALGGKHIKN